MPDEYLPPNKILFLQNLPESVTKEQLLSLFSQLVLFCFVSSFIFIQPFSQIPKSIRSSSYSYQTRYRLRRIRGRRECRCGKGCITQLQAGWRKQDQGTSFTFFSCCQRLLIYMHIFFCTLDYIRQKVAAVVSYHLFYPPSFFLQCFLMKDKIETLLSLIVRDYRLP